MSVTTPTPFMAALTVSGRRCTVVGGGDAALAKVRVLLDGDALVTVVARRAHPELQALAAAGNIGLLERAFAAGDLTGCFLAINTVMDDAVQRQAWDDAQRSGTLLNTVDRPVLCHFSSPALVRRGPLQIAISTSGESPFLAAALREHLEKVIGVEWGQLTGLIGSVRRRLRRRGLPSAEQLRAYRRLLRPDVREHLRQGRFDRAAAIAEALVSGDSKIDGCVHLVGSGPGDPGLLTIAARDLLAAADVVFHDALVEPATLALCGPGAELIDVGKRAGCRQTPQAEINAALIAAARDGKLVVRLKGGDPFVFGRGGEELHALLEAGIAVNVVPGVSAATAAPALAGIPLTHRDVAASLAVVTAQLRDGLADQRLEQIAASVDTLVVLMPLGGLEAISARLARVLTAERPAALIAAASTPRQRTVVGVLADISAQAHHAGLTGPATLVVGEVVRLQSSWSSAVRNRDATAARQTSRSGSIVSGRL